MTRIAVIADVHGNAPALDAVLAEIEPESPDLVVLAGDASGGQWQGTDAVRAGPPEVYERTSPCSTSPRQAPLSTPRDSISSLNRFRSPLTRRSSAPTALPSDSLSPSAS